MVAVSGHFLPWYFMVFNQLPFNFHSTSTVFQFYFHLTFILVPSYWACTNSRVLHGPKALASILTNKITLKIEIPNVMMLALTNESIKKWLQNASHCGRSITKCLIDQSNYIIRPSQSIVIFVVLAKTTAHCHQTPLQLWQARLGFFHILAARVIIKT